eukprot:229111_1
MMAVQNQQQIVNPQQTMLQLNAQSFNHNSNNQSNNVKANGNIATTNTTVPLSNHWCCRHCAFSNINPPNKTFCAKCCEPHGTFDELYADIWMYILSFLPNATHVCQWMQCTKCKNWRTPNIPIACVQSHVRQSNWCCPVTQCHIPSTLPTADTRRPADIMTLSVQRSFILLKQNGINRHEIRNIRATINDFLNNEQIKSYGMMSTAGDDELTFEYSYAFDTNGLVHFLATNCNTQQWQNPAISGALRLGTSGLMDDSEPLHTVVGRTTKRCVTKPLKNAWISIDFLDYAIKPKRYRLRHSGSWPEALRNWRFEGSLDGKTWTILREHQND